MRRPIPPPQNLVRSIDEKWLIEWVDYGLGELAAYLARHAAFDAYYQRRPQSQEGT